jgi:hypothetical protein
MVGYSFFGFAVGLAFVAWLGSTFQKLVVEVPQTWQISLMVSGVAFWLTKRFAADTIKQYQDAKIAAQKSEAAFRQARLDVSAERQEEARSFAPLEAWLAAKKEDETLAAKDVSVDNLRLELIGNTTRIVMDVHNHSGKTITIVGLNFGWKESSRMDQLELTYLTVLPTERIGIEHTVEVSKRFELTNTFAQANPPIEGWISFGFTHNRVVWKNWSNRVEHRITA